MSEETEQAEEVRPSKSLPYWRHNHPDQEALNAARDRKIARLYVDLSSSEVVAARTVRNVEVPIGENEAWEQAAVRVAREATGRDKSGIVLLHLRTSRAESCEKVPPSEDIFDDGVGLGEGEEAG